jgi:hypothetical protein
MKGMLKRVAFQVTLRVPRDGLSRQPTIRQSRTTGRPLLTAFQQVEDNLAALRVLAQVIEQEDSAIESAGRFSPRLDPAPLSCVK